MDMKKILLIVVIMASLMGCNSFIPRQDLYEKVEFKDENIVFGKNNIDLYDVEFPEDYYERIEFFKGFELAGKKMLLENKSLNLLIPQELYRSLERFKRGEFLNEEELYIKTASDLDAFQRGEIDRNIDVAVTERGGKIQSYLNKQIYFWLTVTNKEETFDGSKIYTELDKQRLMEEVRNERKEFFQVLNAMRLSLVVKVEDPYADHSKGDRYWASKEIDLFNPTGISRELQSIKEPLYLENLDEKDIRELLAVRSDFDTPILILESSRLKGYTIREGKYVFYHGGDTLRGYYKGYDMRIRIEETNLENLVTIEEGILLKDILERSQLKVHGIEEEKEVKKQRSLDWGIQ